MKKISLITLHAIKNYGSVLQTFATQVFFENHGYDVEVVNYIRPGAHDSELLNTWVKKDKGLKKVLKKVILYSTTLKWRKVFNGFLNENINLSAHTYSHNEDFKNYPIEADVYVVGSDQVWNSKWNGGIIPEFFLSYAPENKPKVSFASSFGKNQLDNWEINQTKELLNRFKKISVREESAVKIVKDLGIEDVTHILDPTLLFDRDFWKNFASKNTLKKKYLLIYQLNSNKQFDDYAKKIAQKNNLKLVRICTRYDQFYKNGKSILIPSVREFVSLFVNAECVITDSFHATAFSINLNTPFISIYPGNFSTRIESILKLMKLADRHLDNYNQEITLDNIDFSYSNGVLDEQRKQAEKFFKDTMEES